MSEAERFDELWSASLDATLTPAEEQELLALLEGDPSRGDAALERYRLHRLLELATKEDERDCFVRSTMDRIRATDKPTPTGRTRPLAQRLPRSLYFALGVAALLLVALVIATRDKPKPPSSTPARLTLAELDGVIQWRPSPSSEERVLQQGQPIESGLLESLAPEARFRVEGFDGLSLHSLGVTRLAIEAKSEDVIDLERGRLSIDCNRDKGARRLRLRTRDLELDLISARFDIEVEPFASTLRVTEGSLQLTRRSDGSAFTLSAGERATVSILGKATPPQPDRVEPVRTWRADLDIAANSEARMDAFESLELAINKKLELGAITSKESLLYRKKAWGDIQSKVFSKGPLRARRSRVDGIPVELIHLVPPRQGDRLVELVEGGRIIMQGRLKRSADLYLRLSYRHVGDSEIHRLTLRRRVDVGGEGAFKLALSLSELLRSAPRASGGPRELLAVSGYTERDMGLELRRFELLPPS